MATPTVILNDASLKLLVRELSHLDEVKKNLLKVIPLSYLPEGSDLWWARSDYQAEEEVKMGKYTEISSHKELDKFLNKLM